MSPSGQPRLIRVGDIDVNFRLDGAAHAPIVMLAHGLLTSHHMWEGVVRVLASGWRLLRYDLRGHGASGATPGEYSMEQLAQDAIGLLDALEIPRAHFVGISLGGMIGQLLGARYPSRFDTLTLANTTSVQSAGHVWQERIQAAMVHGVESAVEASLQRWFTPAAIEACPELIATIRQAAGRTSLEGFIGCASAVRRLSQRELLAHIRVPTLVVAGTLDQATTLAEARVLVGGIPDSTLAILPAAHQSAAECPQSFAQAWLDFQDRRARAKTA